MIPRAVLRAALCALLAATLGGCASMPFFGSKASSVGDATMTAEAPQYQFEVVAPEPLDKLLDTYLDLARFRNAPRTEAITVGELDSLAAMAPAQART